MNILMVSAEEYLRLRLQECLAPLGAVVHVSGPGPVRAFQASHDCRGHAIDAVLSFDMVIGFLIAVWWNSFQTASVLLMPPMKLMRMLNTKWHFSRTLEHYGLSQSLHFLHSRPLKGVEWSRATAGCKNDTRRASGHGKRLWTQPETRGCCVMRRPLGSETLGCAIERAKGFRWNIRHRDGPKS